MLKKLMLLLSCVSLLILVACGEDGGLVATAEPVPEPLPDGSAPFEFWVEIISDDELADLEDYIEVNYAMARNMFITEGLNLRFNFNQPVTNFSIIEVALLGDGSLAKPDALYEVGNLYPNRPLVMTHYFNTFGWHSFNWNHDSELPNLDDIEGMMPEIDPIDTDDANGVIPTLPILPEADLDLELPNIDLIDLEGMMPEINPIHPEDIVIPDFEVMFASGFSFVDPNGERRWYILQQNQVDGSIIWYPFDWSYEEDLFIDDGYFIDPELPNIDLDDVEGMMPEVDPIIPVDIRIVDSYEGLHNYIEFNYAEARGEEAPTYTYTLLITPSELMPPEEPLRDFEIISISHDHETPEVTGVLFHVGDLMPGTSVLIRSYYGQCTLPGSGFAFGYPRRYFMFVLDQSGNTPGRFIVTEMINPVDTN